MSHEAVTEHARLWLLQLEATSGTANSPALLVPTRPWSKCLTGGRKQPEEALVRVCRRIPRSHVQSPAVRARHVGPSAAVGPRHHELVQAIPKLNGCMSAACMQRLTVSVMSAL